MKLHELKPVKGSTKKRKRLGRGEASGKGGTSTKGNKGQQSRTGYSQKLGHEGGQMPLQRRIPKRGFKNPFRIDYKIFNIGELDKFISKYKLKAISPEELYIHKLIKKTEKIKILSEGDFSHTNIPFKVNKISKLAQEKLEKKGIKIEFINPKKHEK